MNYKPSEKQLKFMDWEVGAFFHFGIRTFNHGHRDWDGLPMPAETFDPIRLDCDQWIDVAKKFGAKYAVMTAKHHDGFALWQSKYSNYSVAQSPWKGGKGDVVREFTDACRRGGIAVGLYYSPAQWGESTVKFENGKEYDDYFINQISELLTNYGKIDYLWFDGCGSGGHEYDRARIIGVIRSLQPDILIFGMWDPDTAWVGNEDGYAPSCNTCVNEINVLGNPKTMFIPYECDCRLRGTWFYDLNEYSLKSVDELCGMYEMSVGRGSNLLLNIGPDDMGLISAPDMKRLAQFRAELDARYSVPHEFEKIKALGGGKYSIEYSDEVLNEKIGDTDFIPLCRSVIIREDISGGIKSRHFRLYAHIPSRNPISDRMICVYESDTVGRCRICRFPAIRTPKFTLEITASDGECAICDMKAYE